MSPFSAPFSGAPKSEGCCFQSERLLYGREPNGVVTWTIAWPLLNHQLAGNNNMWIGGGRLDQESGFTDSGDRVFLISGVGWRSWAVVPRSRDASILLFRPNDGSQLPKGIYLDFGFTRLIDAETAKRCFRNGQAKVQVTWVRAEPGKQKTRSCRTQELAWRSPSKCLPISTAFDLPFGRLVQNLFRPILHAGSSRVRLKSPNI